MRLPINPVVDSAFKALFADPEHSHLLVDLLNAIVRPEVPIERVVYLDPIDEPHYAGHRATIVDVRAEDQVGRVFQVEVQVVIHPELPRRMLYTWARLYARQLKRGGVFEELLPVTSVWLLDRPMLGDGPVHRRYAVRSEQGERLTPDFDLHVIELSRVVAPEPPGDPEEMWLYFLRAARRWTSVPEGMPPLLRQAMEVLMTFSEDDIAYFRYERQLDAERIELSWKRERERIARELEQKVQKLQEVKGQLEETSSQLEETSSQLEETSSQLERREAALAQARETLAAREEALRRAEAELERLRESS